MKKLFVFSIVCLIMLNLMFCSTPVNGPDGPGVPLPEGKLSSEQYNFIVNSTQDTIFLLKKVCDCETGEPVREIHLNPHPCALSRDTFKFSLSQINLSSGVIVPVFGIYLRNSGNTFQGNWVLKDIYFDSSLITNSEDSVQFYSTLLSTKPEKFLVLNFNINTLTAYKRPDSLTFTNSYKESWDRIAGNMYNIDFNVKDSNNVTVTGLNSGDKIEISQKDNHDIAYTCSNTSFKAYTFRKDGMQCPNPFFPSWISSFLNQNRNCSVAGDFTTKFKKQWKDTLILKWEVLFDSLSTNRFLLVGKRSGDTVNVEQKDNCIIYYRWLPRDSVFYNDKDPIFSQPKWLGEFLGLNSKIK